MEPRLDVGGKGKRGKGKWFFYYIYTPYGTTGTIRYFKIWIFTFHKYINCIKNSKAVMM